MRKHLSINSGMMIAVIAVRLSLKRGYLVSKAEDYINAIYWPRVNNSVYRNFDTVWSCTGDDMFGSLRPTYQWTYEIAWISWDGSVILFHVPKGDNRFTERLTWIWIKVISDKARIKIVLGLTLLFVLTCWYSRMILNSFRARPLT